jgi:fumarate reductase subunit C
LDLRIKPHPFYEPYLRRVAIVVSIAIWFSVELLISKSGFWTPLAGGTLAYSIWAFLIAYPKPE